MTRRRVTTLAGLVLTSAIALAGCSSASPASAPSSVSAASAAAEENVNLALGTSMGGKQAPGFTLTTQFGEKMSLSQFKGCPSRTRSAPTSAR